MLQTSARLLRLLSLFQAKRYWAGAELAERLDVTPRTLRRDVDRLRDLGYPVNSTSGVAGGYQLGVGASMPPLLLDDDEAVAVAVGLRTAASGTVAGIEETSVRALAKLEQLLPSRLRRRVAALNAFITPMTACGPTVDAGMLSLITAACRDCDGLSFSYSSRDGSASHRNVEPLQLVHTGRRWYLVAWDVEREDWRTFRVDRIQAMPRTGGRFKVRRPPAGGAAAYVSRSIAYETYPHRATVVLHASRETMAEKIPPTVGVLEAVDEGRCVLRSGGPSADFLAFFLVMCGVDFEVQEPVELRDQIRGLADRFVRAAARA